MLGGIITSPLCKTVSHFDLHDFACYSILMSKERRVQKFAVQQYVLGTFAAFGIILYHDAGYLFAREIGHGSAESRTSDRIYRPARVCLVEPRRVECVSCRRLSVVFIAGQLVDVIGILTLVNIVH